MSCRIAVNMAKRAAAGAVNVSVSSENEIDDPCRAADIASISRSRKLASCETIKRRYDLQLATSKGAFPCGISRRHCRAGDRANRVQC
jgi:hypothetical protein